MLNSDGVEVHKGGSGSGGDTGQLPQHLYYCGRRMNECRCGECDGRCGPTNGCPCNSCLRLSPPTIINSDGVTVHKGGSGTGGDTRQLPQNLYYCGRRMNECRCGECDGRCGPTSGCPCNSCLELLSHKMFNSDGVPAHKGKSGSGGDTGQLPQNLYYCGRQVNQCRCGKCDGRCGPSNGCPCNSCLQLSFSAIAGPQKPTASEMELPENISELKKALESRNDYYNVIKRNTSKIHAESKLIIDYCTSSMKSGRPLKKVIVMLAGESGTGKSSTINQLFDDQTLCPTSFSSSKTSQVALCSKSLNVTHKSNGEKMMPILMSKLTFVDVPGSLDTDSAKESKNFATIANFRKTDPSLKNRDVSTLSGIFSISKTVYPNVIMFVISSSDTRMDGPDSSLTKSLKILKKLNVVDLKMCNLMIVSTHATSLGINKNNFQIASENITHTVQKVVKEIFNISNVPVIFVENAPENYNLQKARDSDFYQLPNGELSHHNLCLAMFDILKKNHDALGLLLTSWFMNPKCPDRKSKVEVSNVKIRADDERCEINEAANALRELRIEASSDDLTPVYDFNSLGYGFCTVTESVRAHRPLKDDGVLKILNVQNSRFRIPNSVQFYNEAQTNVRQLSFKSKDEYESRMKYQYELDANMCLKVIVSANGKWSSENNVWSEAQTTDLSLLNEIRVARMQIVNPDVNISEELAKTLQGLPSSYNKNPEDYESFFSKWGTHFIYKMYVGGSIKMDCLIQTAKYKKHSESEVNASAKAIFKIFSPGGSYSSQSLRNQLQSIGISEKQLTISGGDPPLINSMEEMTPEMYSQWRESVLQNPKELEHTVALYPYFNLTQFPIHRELKKATLDYLSRGVIEIRQKTRDQLAKKGQQQSEAVVESSSCFPASTLISTPFGQKRITELKKGDILSTVKFNGENERRTKFLTFLHKNAETKAMFLVLKFSNGVTLKVTEDHLLQIYQMKKLVPKMAGKVSLGDKMIYYVNGEGITYPELVDVKQEEIFGVFCPLTDTGMFLANGFLVTCYADIESFRIAHLAMAPLRLWHRLLEKSSLKPVDCNTVQKKSEGKTGIHDYAEFLMTVKKCTAIFGKICTQVKST